MMKKNRFVNSSQFRAAYEKLYREMRNYLWSVNALELLASIEVEIYKSFIDLPDVENKLAKLYQYIRDVAKEDEYLQEAYDNLSQLIEDNIETPMYFTLRKVEEV